MATRKRTVKKVTPFSRLVRDVRGDRRQVEAAALSGLAQSKISRAEQGRHTFTPAEAEHFGATLGATPDQAAELVRLAQEAENHIQGQTRLVRRGGEIQRRIGTLERASTVMRSWQPTVVPGMLQSWSYTLAYIEIDPTDAWIRARKERLALLDEPGRQFRQILSEAALRWVIGSRKVMAEQMEHLATLTEHPNVELGVVPFGQIIVPPPEGAFHLYSGNPDADDPVPPSAVVATDVGTTFLNDADDLNFFSTQFDRLAAVAEYGDGARRLIDRAARAR